MTRVLGDHLRESRPAAPDVRPLPSTVALIALDASVPVIDLAARLADALRWHERVAVLDGSGVDAPRPGTTPAAGYGPLLDRVEADAERVLLVAPIAAPDDAWTQFCLQQGDRLLAIAHEEMPAALRLARSFAAATSSPTRPRPAPVPWRGGPSRWSRSRRIRCPSTRSSRPTSHGLRAG